MKRYIAPILIILGLISLFAAYGSPARAQSTDGRFAAFLDLDTAILPNSANFLSRGIDQAVDEGAELIIIQLDTPGGLLDTTRDMVSSILQSEIPVVVYVAPAGARAASAGTFITAAAHIAAMDSATNIGAASVVGSGGEDLPDTLKSKVTEDVAAFIRVIAEERGRNADVLQSTVLEAKSFTAKEALENNIIDIVADDIDDLLSQINGMTVELEQGNNVDDVVFEGFLGGEGHGFEYPPV